MWTFISSATLLHTGQDETGCIANHRTIQDEWNLCLQGREDVDSTKEEAEEEEEEEEEEEVLETIHFFERFAALGPAALSPSSAGSSSTDPCVVVLTSRAVPFFPFTQQSPFACADRKTQGERSMRQIAQVLDASTVDHSR